MLHRDLSPNNIMYKWQDGRPHFILIDFDMARELPADPKDYLPSSKHRTGTLAFIAGELLVDIAEMGLDGYVPTPHRLRHDFESLNYISYWCASTMVENNDEKQKARALEMLSGWETGSYSHIASNKETYRTRYLPAWTRDLPKLAVEAGLDQWFNRWASIFRRVRGAKDAWNDGVRAPYPSEDGDGSCPKTFDDETMNGLMTRDSIKRVLMWADTEVYTPPAVDELDEDADFDGNPMGALDPNGTPYPIDANAADLRGFKWAPEPKERQPKRRKAPKRRWTVVKKKKPVAGAKKQPGPAGRAKTESTARKAVKEAASPVKQMQKGIRRSSRLAKMAAAVPQAHIMPEVVGARPGPERIGSEAVEAVVENTHVDQEVAQEEQGAAEVVPVVANATQSRVPDNEMRRRLRIRKSRL